MQVIRYESAQIHQWNDFVKTSKNGFFMFDRGYMDYHADRFVDHSLMIYDAQGKLLALLPANERDGVLYSHQGLTFGGLITGKSMRMDLMMAAFDALMSYARATGFARIVYKAIPYFYHKQPAQEDLYALFRCGARCFRVDVSSTISHQQPRYVFSSSRKSGLKKAADAGLQVVESDGYAAFFALLNDLLDDKYGVSATHSAEEIMLLQSRFPKNIRLFACYENEAMIGGVLVYETDCVAHTQYIGANARGKEIGALDLILQDLIGNRYADKNYFDFGISTEQGGMYLNEGLISQKEGAGARATVHQFFEIDLAAAA